jgi:hypothetical protein
VHLITKQNGSWKSHGHVSIMWSYVQARAWRRRTKSTRKLASSLFGLCKDSDVATINERKGRFTRPHSRLMQPNYTYATGSKQKTRATQ